VSQAFIIQTLVAHIHRCRELSHASRTDPYRERVLASTGRDPLRCTRCGGEMLLWQVWHPRYGVVYDELQAIKRGRCGPCRGSPPGAGADGDGAKAMTQLTLADLGV
jgi:hypothetical protein